MLKWLQLCCVFLVFICSVNAAVSDYVSPMTAVGEISGYNSEISVACGNYLYQFDASACNITVFNITNPLSAVQLGSYESCSGDYSIDRGNALVVDSNCEYMYANSFFDGKVVAFNITDKSANPSTVGFYSVSWSYGLALLEDKYLYATDNIGNTVYALDVSGHGNPTLDGSISNAANPCSTDGAMSVISDGADLIYVIAEDDATVTVLDISAHGNPTCDGQYTKSSSPNSVDTQLGGYPMYLSGKLSLYSIIFR
jgi:hypothetical protein